MKARIAIMASGEGSNAENIIRHFKGHDTISVVMVLSNNPQAPVLQRATQLHIPVFVFDRQQLRETGEVLRWLQREKATHIILAGFLWLVPGDILHAFKDRIINIHPALLPRYGGKGMYGSRVHEAVKNSGDLETGITIHLVDPRYDEGRIIFQQNCAVSQSDSADDIAEKVHALEYKYYPRVIEDWISRQTSIT